MLNEISENQTQLESVFKGVLLGTAVGDSVGLPAEGMTKGRIARRWHGQWRQRFLWGWGMCSDDTEHTFLVAQALLACPDDPAAFQRRLASSLRYWLLGIPAGIGLATLRAILKLWLGVPSSRSGVYSAGNGPAMRSAVSGAYFFNAPEKRKQYVRASTRLTHTDPKAEIAAFAIAEAAAWIVHQDKPLRDWAADLCLLSADEEWKFIGIKINEALGENKSVASFAASLGLSNGVTGYCYHTVPISLYAWLRSPTDFRQALESALQCGGDTDTVGAILGALAGASAGPRNIPSEWLERICEWPRSKKVLAQIAQRLAEQRAAGCALGPVKYFWPWLIPRNILFLVVVLAHGFRRLAPPY